MPKQRKEFSIKFRRRARFIVKILTVLLGIVGTSLALTAGAYDVHLEIPTWMVVTSITCLLLSLFGLWMLSPEKGE